MGERICSIEGCRRKHYARGLCRKCYDDRRWGEGFDGFPTTLQPRQPCSVDGCEKLAHSAGFCDKHYARWKAWGDVGFVSPRGGLWNGSERERQAPSCWCGDPSFATSLCRRHYLAERRRLNPAQYVEYAERRRARKHAAPCTLSTDEWEAIRDAYDGRCAYCGDPADTQDHVVPFSRGGHHVAENVVPACGHCNFTKNDRLPGEWGRWPDWGPHPFV